jgi:DNA-binding response OmpR family regulator
LDAGADDFVLRPVSTAELLARLRALLRRQPPSASNILRVGALCLDWITWTITRGEHRSESTNREFGLLEILMLTSPHAVSKAILVERIFGRRVERTNVVHVHIAHLRKKINVSGCLLSYIRCAAADSWWPKRKGEVPRQEGPWAGVPD